MVNPAHIQEAEIYGMPEPDLPPCVHCGEPANPDIDVECELYMGQPHCDDCIKMCEVCKHWYCGEMHETEGGETLCKECYKNIIEALTIKISEPICEGLGKLGYRFASERRSNGQAIFQFTSDELPTLEVRFSTQLQGIPVEK